MKARIKGETEWKEYKAAFGPCGEFQGLETKGFVQNEEEWCKENGIPYDPESPFNSPNGHYISAILPLEAFDLWEEPDWSAFRREAAKDILAGMIAQIPPRDYGICHAEVMAEYAVLYTDKLIKKLKEDEK